MELKLLSFPILFSLLLVFVFISIVSQRTQTKNSASKLPPRPWTLPLVGNLHQLLGSLPHHSLSNLAKKYGPFMYLKIGQIPTIVVSSPEYAKEILRTHDIIFANRPRTLASQILFYEGKSIIFAPHGEYWRQLRRICMQELLSPSRIHSFQPIREEEMFNMIDQLIASSKVGSSINLSRMVKTLTYGITARVAFGKKSSDHEEFISLVEEFLKSISGFEFSDVFPSLGFLDWNPRAKYESLKLRASRIMENIIKEHTHHDEEKEKSSGEGEDFVDVLLKFHNNNGDVGFTLTSDNIKAIIFDIFLGGSETSAITVDWAMVEMMRNPRVMKKAQDEVRKIFGKKGLVNIETSINEMKYLKSIVKETLRLHPPAPLLLPRENREKGCIINGYEIPMKTKVIINIWAIGRDQKYWIEPENFMPERFVDCSVDFKGNNFEFLPFGGGRRICPGMSYGVINVEFILALLLYYFDWKLPNKMKYEDLDMKELFGSVVSRKDNLYLVPTTYVPL
uniref:Cytochrome P450 n=1 Tax=Cannabis sativa TaxID=3483 RepID=A0A803PV00_CANSA